MTDAERLVLYESALRAIATFGHAESCNPALGEGVYSCGCYDKSQWIMAREALEAAGMEWQPIPEPGLDRDSNTYDFETNDDDDDWPQSGDVEDY